MSLFFLFLCRFDVQVVREVYDDNESHEQFALELERCLEAGPATIVIGTIKNTK